MLRAEWFGVQMNKILQKCLSILVVLSITFFSIKPLDEGVATVISAVGGICAGVTSGAGVYFLAFDNSSNQSTRITVSGLAAFGCDVLVNYFLYHVLYKITPSGRLAVAQQLVNDASTDHLINKNFESYEEFTMYVTSRFGDDYPLALAHEHYTDVTKYLNLARELLTRGYKEAYSNKKYVTQYNDLIQKISKLEQTINVHISVILKDEKKYLSQALRLEKHKFAELKRKYERRESQYYYNRSENETLNTISNILTPLFS